MCDLCLLEKISTWYYEDDLLVVCDCIICRIPQVVLREHTMFPPTETLELMEDKLNTVANEFYENSAEFYIDKNQRNIKDHIHWHARRKKDI